MCKKTLADRPPDNKTDVRSLLEQLAALNPIAAALVDAGLSAADVAYFCDGIDQQTRGASIDPADIQARRFIAARLIAAAAAPTAQEAA